MPYGQLFAPQIGPAQGAEFAKQHSSAMRWVPRTDAVVLAARLRDCVDAAQGHKSETRSVSYLFPFVKGGAHPFAAEAQNSIFPVPGAAIPSTGLLKFSES